MAGDGLAAWFNQVQYGASDERLLQSVLGMPASSTRVRSGVRAGGGLGVTVGGTPEAATVATGGGVITDTGAGAGSYIFVLPSTVAKNLQARPPSGQSRLDEVVAFVKNYDERPADGLNIRELDVAIITGTPSSGTPSPPSFPAGQLRLAELVVPATGTPVTVQKPLQRTVALGGVLPVASQAEEDAIEVIYDGMVIYREDLDIHKGRQNGSWERFAIAGRGGTPFAEAAGKTTISGASVGANGGSVTVDVNFPAGRFTVAPLVNFGFNGFVGGAGLLVPRQPASVTTAGCTLVFINHDNSADSWTNLPVWWRALQMTATTADG